VDPLEQVSRHEVLEALWLAGDDGPVEVVVLLLLLHRPQPRRAERRQSEHGVQPLEDLDPSSDGGVADLEVLAQRIDREWRTDEIRKPEREQLEPAEIAHALEIGHLLAKETAPILPRPPSCLLLAGSEPRLGESSERHEVSELRGRRQAELGDGERVKSKQVVAPLQRVAAVPVIVEPRAVRDENLLAAAAAVPGSLEIPPPEPVPVDLVEDPERRDRKLPAEAPGGGSSPDPRARPS
jgi:hypothetical protein